MLERCKAGRKHPRGGRQDGLSIRATRRPLSPPRAAHTLDRQAGPRRSGVQHLSPAIAWHHLPPVHDPDLRDRLYAHCGPCGLRLVLGNPRRSARYQPLVGQLHPARPGPRATVNVGITAGIYPGMEAEEKADSINRGRSTMTEKIG